MLYYSSLLLNTVLIYSYLLRYNIIFFLTLNLLSTSLIFHSKYNDEYYGKELIEYLDKSYANSLSLYIFLCNTLYPITRINLTIYFCIFYNIFIFYCTKRSNIKYFTIHLNSVIGLNLFLYQYSLNY